MSHQAFFALANNSQRTTEQVDTHLVLHAWCQMSNHYHLVLETVEGNLSQGMR